MVCCFRIATSVMQRSKLNGSRSAKRYERFFTRIVKLVYARRNAIRVRFMESVLRVVFYDRAL